MKNYFIDLWAFTKTALRRSPSPALSPLYLAIGFFVLPIANGTMTMELFMNMLPGWIVLSLIMLIIPMVGAHALIKLGGYIKSKRAKDDTL